MGNIFVKLRENILEQIKGEVNDRKSGEKSSICSICMDVIENISELEECRHQFCFKCIIRWSESQRKCPLCRQVFTKILHNKKSGLYESVHHLEPRLVFALRLDVNVELNYQIGTQGQLIVQTPRTGLVVIYSFPLDTTRIRYTYRHLEENSTYVFHSQLPDMHLVLPRNLSNILAQLTFQRNLMNN